MIAHGLLEVSIPSDGRVETLRLFAGLIHLQQRHGRPRALRGGHPPPPFDVGVFPGAVRALFPNDPFRRRQSEIETVGSARPLVEGQVAEGPIRLRLQVVVAVAPGQPAQVALYEASNAVVPAHSRIGAHHPAGIEVFPHQIGVQLMCSFEA